MPVASLKNIKCTVLYPSRACGVYTQFESPLIHHLHKSLYVVVFWREAKCELPHRASELYLYAWMQYETFVVFAVDNHHIYAERYLVVCGDG